MYMNRFELEKLLREVKSGEADVSQAAKYIKDHHFEDLGFARVDHSRAARQGFPEVIFGSGKTREQIVGIFEKLAERTPNVLVTRTDKDTFGELRNVATECEWHESAKMVRLFRDKSELGIGEISFVTAGTSDIPI